MTERRAMPADKPQRAPWPPRVDVMGRLSTRGVQACLKALGRWDGPLDGKATKAFEAAVVAYQKAERPWRTGFWKTDGSTGPVFCDGLIKSLAGVDRPGWYE